MKEIVIWAEQQNGRLMDVSLEILQKAKELANTLEAAVSAILIGDRCTPLADELIHHGAENVFIVEDERLGLYQSDIYAKIIHDILSERKPEIFLAGGTSIGLELAPRVAAKLNTGLTAHCVDLYIEKIDGKEQLIQVVPGWGGRMMLKIICPEHRPQMATIRPGVMEKGKADPSRTGEIISITPPIENNDFKAKTLEFIREAEQEISLEKADIIVSGGFGLYSTGGFQLVEQLARAFQGEVAGTRPVFDQGWIPETRMIGQSGKTVSPKLFVSIGASGAIHYTTGFLKSKVILAIDKNPKAPIFDVADFGIVGDLNKIVPCLIEELKKS